MSETQFNLMNLLYLGPLLTIIATRKQENKIETYTTLKTFTYLLPFIVRIPESKNSLTIYILTILYWVILFIFMLIVSYMQNSSSDTLYNILYFFGIFTIILHLILLIMQPGNDKKKENKN